MIDVTGLRATFSICLSLAAQVPVLTSAKRVASNPQDLGPRGAHVQVQVALLSPAGGKLSPGPRPSPHLGRAWAGLSTDQSHPELQQD